MNVYINIHIIPQLYPQKEPGNSDNPIAMNTLGTQILTSKYYSQRKGNQGPLGEMADSRFKTAKVKDKTKTYYCTRK